MNGIIVILMMRFISLSWDGNHWWSRGFDDYESKNITNYHAESWAGHDVSSEWRDE